MPNSKFRFEVLGWLIPRKTALKYLSADLNDKDSSPADFSVKEIAMMKVVVEDTNESTLFWACAHLSYQLACWGANVSSWFHSCPLSSHGHVPGKPSCYCQWKGRMSAKLAQGSWIDSYSQELLNLALGSAHQFLQKLPGHEQESLLNDFAQCKVVMAQRFIQVFSFWRELPWRICAVGIPLFCDTEDATTMEEYVRASKLFAQEVLETWSSSSANQKASDAFLMPRMFLDRTYPKNLAAYMVWWASTHELVMPASLAMMLMQYCSALTCMQSLEAQHHGVNQQVSFGRASLPASTCAFLRRRTNPDIHDQYFRKHVGRFIQDLSSLVAVDWNNRTDT